MTELDTIQFPPELSEIEMERINLRVMTREVDEEPEYPGQPSVVIQVSGEVNRHSSFRFVEELKNQRENDVNDIALDMSETRYVGPWGYVNFEKAIRIHESETGGKVTIERVDRVVGEYFEFIDDGLKIRELV